MQRVRLFVAWLLIALALLAVLIANRWWVPDVGLVVYVDTFVAIFLGIMYEAVPFLTAGSLVAAAIHLFVQPEWLTRILPKHRLLQNPKTPRNLKMLRCAYSQLNRQSKIHYIKILSELSILRRYYVSIILDFSR